MSGRGNKSFAQHLQEIEQEAARAASRVRMANSKAHSALGDFSTGMPPASPLSERGENTPAGNAGASSAGLQLAAAQREAVRMAWDLSVLKRAMPEIEAAATTSERLAEAFRMQGASSAAGRGQSDVALAEMRATLKRSQEEAATLRARNAELEREISGLRRMSADGLAPMTPQTGMMRGPPGSADLVGSGSRRLSEISPLLRGLDESATRSRGSAYWRRARMCLKVASIADYWQTTAAKSAGPGPGMGTPMPGRMPGQQTGGLPTPTGQQKGAHPRVAAIARKVDVAISDAVAGALLKVGLADSSAAEAAAEKGAKAPPKTSEREKTASAVAAAKAAAEKVVGAASDEQVPRAERPEFKQKLTALSAGASTGAAFAEAMARAPGWVSAIVASTSVVIDQNMPPLTAHLHTILKDTIADAVRSLQKESVLGTPVDEAAARQKGTAVFQTLVSAVDNVQQQFVVGLRSSVPPAQAAMMGKSLLDALCEQAVGERCERLRALTTVDELTSRVWEEVAIVQDFLGGVSSDGGAQSWLQQLILQERSFSNPSDPLQILF